MEVIMSKLKSGDIVEIEAGFTKNFYRGDRFEFITPKNNDLVIVRSVFTIHKNNLKKVGENMKYTESNRYKLQQAIKKTGFHAEKLSLASNHAKTYFTGFTAESRFNSRGDITDERLNSLLTTLAFAERELLGVGAKNVDDVAIDEPSKEKEVIVNVTEMQNQYYDDSKSNDLYSNYFESASKINQSKRDAKVKNFLIAFLVVVVLLALWFLFK